MGYICGGRNPSLSEDIVVYESNGSIYMRWYVGISQDEMWTEAYGVAVGEWPYVYRYGDSAYVFYSGDEGALFVHGGVDGGNWSDPEVLYSGNTHYVSGLVRDIPIYPDTQVNPGMGLAGDNQQPIPGSYKHEIYVVFTSSVERGKRWYSESGLFQFQVLEVVLRSWVLNCKVSGLWE